MGGTNVFCQMKKLLVIGTNSFIGTNFHKFSENQEITEVSLRETNPDDIDFREVDVILHLAAIVHQSKRINKQVCFHVNRDLPVSVAEHAKKAGVKQFVFLSTVKVYGKFISGSDPWTEDSACYPYDDYGESKYSAEVALKNMEDESFVISIIRTPIVYGPGVKANMLKMIRLVEKFSLLPFWKVNNNRHYTYIENLIGFIDRIIEIRASGTFIAMDDFGLSTTDLVKYLVKFLHRKIILFKVPDIFISFAVSLKVPAVDQLYGSFYLDNCKTKKLLDYEPLFSSEEGIGKMISYYLESKKIKNTK